MSPTGLSGRFKRNVFGATTQQAHSAIVGGALPRRMTVIATPYRAALTVEKEQ